MRLNRLFYFLVLLLVLPVYGFGQTVPVAPNMLLDIGGLGTDVISTDLKFDAQGNIYVAGNYIDNKNAIDFDPSAGVTTVGSNGSSCFIAKYSAAGALVWVKSFGEDGRVANGLDIDRNGNITVIGRVPSKKQKEPYDINIYEDAFILHLDNSGNVLWEKLIESRSKIIPVDPYGNYKYYDIQTGYKVASDDDGNLIAVFSFDGSPDVDGKVTAKGITDGLVVKYDTNGNVIWKFNLGATGNYSNLVLQALVDKDNNIIIAGYINGTVNYNPLGTPVNVNGYYMFLAKYSPAGILQWIKNIDGYLINDNMRLALDGQNNIYINGAFFSRVDFGVAPTLTPTSIGSQDIFIAKYSSGGNLLYHTSIGGTKSSMLDGGMVVGPDNSLYLTGNFTGKVDVDPSSSVAELTSKGAIDMFLAKYDDNGNYQWAFGVAGIKSYGNIPSANPNSNDELFKIGARYINVNSSNEIFVTGGFDSSVNFDATGCGVSNMTAKSASGLNDMFIVRYTPTTEKPVTNNTVTAPVVTAICPGDDPGLITGSTPIGDNYTYQWQQSLDNITFTDISGAHSKDFAPPAITETTYYRRSLPSSVCEIPNISNVVTLTLSTSAFPNTITAPAVNIFCNAGDAGLIGGSAPQAVGNIAYQWQQSTDNVTFTDISGAIAKDYDPPPISVTTYYRRLINNAPCSIAIPGNTVTITVTQLTVSAEQTICIGNSVTLNATGGSRYSWSPATGLSSADGASPVATPGVTTTYSVTIYNGDCSITLPVKVNVISRPTVDAGADKDVISDDKVQLNARVSVAEGATYSWAPTTYLDNPNIANPTASPLKNITYRLTVTTAQGCFIVSDEVAIKVHEKIIVPNTFTPNGDGINDILTIDGLNSYKQSLLTIFDRNGQQVFKSLAYPKPWDGTRNGKPIPMGTYYYVIDLKNGSKILSGWVTIVK